MSNAEDAGKIRCFIKKTNMNHSNITSVQMSRKLHYTTDDTELWKSNQSTIREGNCIT